MGVMGFVDAFKGQDGDMFDKILAGLTGFSNGLLKALTIPLDWIIDLTAKVLDFFGFDGAAKVLEEFSLSAMVDSLTDGVLGLPAQDQRRHHRVCFRRMERHQEFLWFRRRRRRSEGT